ncbi:MAG: LLM class flavin-dependent oxidoreductase [Halobacteriota archaeon]
MKTKLGYMVLLEKAKPNECLRYAVKAEDMGFDSVWVDDHFFPFAPLTECGFAWCFMASALQATKKIYFSTAVTAPIMRYNPAVVAQAFMTMQSMYPGRVGLGVGTGEDLNEIQLLGGEFPSAKQRLEMLSEAVDIIKELWTSEKPFSCNGNYCMTDVFLHTKHDARPSIYFSGLGPKASKLAGLKGDHLITLVTNPQVLNEVVFPNFEAGAREAGKDPSKMERVCLLNLMYDKDKAMKKGRMQVPATDFEATVSVVQEPGDIINEVLDLKDAGFNHIILTDNSQDNEPGLDAMEEVTAYFRK